MEFQELKKYLIRLYKDYVKKHLNKILISLVLSLFVAGSTSATAWLLDPAVKKIFIEQDRTLAWLIPILIILAFSTKGVSLYFARMTIIRVAQEVAGEIQKKIANNIIRLLQNEELCKEMGRKAREHSLSFSASNSIREWKNLLICLEKQNNRNLKKRFCCIPTKDSFWLFRDLILKILFKCKSFF